MDPFIIIFGLGVGLLVGATGLGAASIMTPLLILVFGVKPVTAIGTDLAYGAITKTVGGWRHFRQGTVSMGVSGWLAIGSIPGAVVGVWLIGHLERAFGSGFETTLLLLIAGAVALVGAIALGRALFRRRPEDGESDSPELTRGLKIASVAIGFPVGVLLGITSVGSGALIALALIMVYKLTPHRVVGTDVFHAAILLWVAAGAHVLAGNVDWFLAANILVGSLPGVWVGAKLAMRIPERALRPALGIVLLTVASALVLKAGIVEVPSTTILVVPLALGALTWLALALRGRPVATGEA